jgi:hypothetical protein
MAYKGWGMLGSDIISTDVLVVIPTIFNELACTAPKPNEDAQLHEAGAHLPNWTADPQGASLQCHI